MNEWMWYDPDGNPITVDEWTRMRKGPDSVWERERLFIRIGDGDNSVAISTVWLGLDHQYDPDGPPLIFETMIFGGVFDQEQWRYSTREQAHAGHADAVRHARAAIHAAFGEA